MNEKPVSEELTQIGVRREQVPEPDEGRRSLDLDKIRARLESSQGPLYWKSLEELAETKEFQAFVDRYGDTATAPAARYWLGEARFIQKDYAGAATAYLGAIRGWPKTAWAGEAVVKLSQSLVELNKPADACGALGEFDRRYRNASPALKARAAAVRLKAQCPA